MKEEAKAAVAAQFADLMDKMAKLDRVQHPLIEELHDLKKQISEYDQRRAAISVSLFGFVPFYILTRLCRRRQRLR